MHLNLREITPYERLNFIKSLILFNVYICIIMIW